MKNAPTIALTELSTAEMQEITGGGFVGNLVILGRGVYYQAKGIVSLVPLAGGLANSLLSSFVDPLIDAA